MIFPLLLVVVPGWMHSFDEGSNLWPNRDRLSIDHCRGGYQPSKQGYQDILYDIIVSSLILSCRVRYISPSHPIPSYSIMSYRILLLVQSCELCHVLLSYVLFSLCDYSVSRRASRRLLSPVTLLFFFNP